MATRQRQKAEKRREERKALGPSAKLRWLRMSPRKVRLVVDLVRGKRVEDALNVLTFCDKAAAKPVAKLLRSAVANADNHGDYDIDKLFERLGSNVDALDGLVHTPAFAKEEDLINGFINTTRDGFKLALDISCYSLVA